MFAAMCFFWASTEKGLKEGFEFYVDEMYCIWIKLDCDDLLLVDFMWCDA